MAPSVLAQRPPDADLVPGELALIVPPDVALVAVVRLDQLSLLCHHDSRGVDRRGPLEHRDRRSAGPDPGDGRESRRDILRRLGFHSRIEVATLIARNGPDAP